MQAKSEYSVQFEEVYTSYYSRMQRFAQEYVIHEEDAENIVHDIFTELWEKKPEFDSHINLNGYIFVILKNKCIDFLRRKTTEHKAINKMQEEYLQTLKLKFESLEALDDKLLSDPDIDTIIQNAIDGLPERCRQIFVMNKIEGKKQKQIAQELGISVNTVESQVAIAYKKLKEALKDYIPLVMFLFI
ncbi:MAG: RNA polymerase sigma-70 factor [Bacteroidia bacterium]|nr:RNA polymerase sigma-70 factor [Bacteroidia bacterium]